MLYKGPHLLEVIEFASADAHMNRRHDNCASKDKNLHSNSSEPDKRSINQGSNKLGLNRSAGHETIQVQKGDTIPVLDVF